MPRLRITEIFYSIQGESRTLGWPTVFIRLTGCPLRCGYCDTEYAFTGGRWMQLEEILEQVAGFAAGYVTVTGGEPLAQRPCLELLTSLADAGYAVSLETSGALDVTRVDPRIVRVMDLKTPGSGEAARNRYENLSHLGGQDQVKFVICDRLDYRWAKERLEEYNLAEKCEVLFSPCSGRQDPAALAEWILQDGLPVRFQMQLHRVLWGDTAGR